MEAMPSPSLDASREDREAGAKLARKQIRGLLGNLLYSQDKSVERRRQLRYPFPQPVYLTLVNEDVAAGQREPIVAAAKDLSESGIGFYHTGPLPSREMTVSLQVTKGHWMAFVIEVMRSREIRQGWYESGARFLRPVPPPPLTTC